MDFDKCVEPIVYSVFMHVWHFMTLWAYLGLHEWIHLYTILFFFLVWHCLSWMLLSKTYSHSFWNWCSHVCIIMIEAFFLFNLLQYTTILSTISPYRPLWVYIFPLFHLTHYKPKCKTIFFLSFPLIINWARWFSFGLCKLLSVGGCSGRVSVGRGEDWFIMYGWKEKKKK